MPPVRRSLAAVSLCLLALAACGEPEPVPPPPPKIPVVAVLERDQPIKLDMVGETRGSVEIPIRARVDGVLEGMHFVEGEAVEKGALLYTIDPRPFRAKVAEMQGRVAEAQTAVVKDRSQLDRIRPLAEIHAVSQQDLEAAVAQYEAALGALKAAEAQLEQARIQLGYTRVHAPAAGRLGITRIRVGEYVGAGSDALLNQLSETDPIRVRFSIDERNYLRLARESAGQGPDRSGEGPGLELFLTDGSLHEGRGQLVGTQASIDPSTGTFTLEADFPNPNGILVAGQFARVRAVIETRKNALLVPDRALSELQGSYRVFVVGEDGTVALRPVTVGPRVERLRIVEEGLRAGESIALEGLQLLREGAVVVPQPTALDASGNVVEAAAAPAGPPGA